MIKANDFQQSFAFFVAVMNNINIDYSVFKPFLQTKKEKGKPYIFCSVRKKNLVLTPEEVVRQLTIQYLLRERNCNIAHLRAEMGIKYHDRLKRCDIIYFNKDIAPILIVECKAPTVPITAQTLLQITTYNLTLKVPYLLITNLVETYCCVLDYEKNTYEWVEEVPYFGNVK